MKCAIFCLIFDKSGFPRQIFTNVKDTKLHPNRSGDSRTDTRGQSDGQKDTTKITGVFFAPIPTPLKVYNFAKQQLNYWVSAYTHIIAKTYVTNIKVQLDVTPCSLVNRFRIHKKKGDSKISRAILYVNTEV